jgi:hypothetical protein
VFERLGSKPHLAARLLAYARERPELQRVIPMCEPIAGSAGPEDQSVAEPRPIGSVYLLKSGRYYKIGHTNALGRRERELAVQLPEKARVVHEIRTDDPGGIEAYWHKRFEAKRKHGEWFELSQEEVACFRRRSFM